MSSTGLRSGALATIHREPTLLRSDDAAPRIATSAIIESMVEELNQPAGELATAVETPQRVRLAPAERCDVCDAEMRPMGHEQVSVHGVFAGPGSLGIIELCVCLTSLVSWW
jgi:hypothetical protein